MYMFKTIVSEIENRVENKKRFSPPIPNYTFSKKENLPKRFHLLHFPKINQKKSTWSPKEKNLKRNLSHFHYLVISNVQTACQAIVSFLLFMAMVQEYKFGPFEEILFSLP